MAFQNKKLSVIAYANGFTLWHYAANETLATISASGYFNNVITLMNTGDIILINASDKTTIMAITVAENAVSVAALD
ncbi:MAG: hypothetical protein KBT14_01595 [Proteobacteria bacterium]|nr:hypothetical protein [Candidatus Enterousia onthequi]MCQ2581267.1 hypothetical protein [Alphaproteobacteria bacterium]